MIHAIEQPVVIGDAIAVTVRVLAGRQDVALSGGRLELHVLRSAPAIGIVYGVTSDLTLRDTIVTAPLEVPNLLAAKARLELVGNLPTGAIDGIGPTGAGKMSVSEYRIAAVVDMADGGHSRALTPVVLQNPRSLYARVEQHRDTADTPANGELELRLDPPAVPVGGRVAGVVTVRPGADFGAAEDVAVGLVRLLEHTEPSIPGLVRTRETTMGEYRIPLPHRVEPGSQAEVAFELDGPDEPTYYDGVRFSVRWLVFAWLHRVHQPDVAVRRELNVYSGPG